ncbi:MAG: hypothetical protein AB1758_06715 [Candidatus Eremiobacterota bacterium]
MAVGAVDQATLPAVAPRASTTPGALARETADQALGRRTSGAVTVADAQVPAVRDADHAPDPTDRAAIRQQQADFVGTMRDAGIRAGNPPTRAQLREYFGTFNNAERRGEALEQFENYTTAFHVHTAEVEGHRQDDVRYSPETSYYSNGQYFRTEREARREARQEGNTPFYGRISSADASRWRDVNSRPGYNGRKIQDCEGFAYMSQELLGAAGYEVTHTNNQGADGSAHSMTVVRDPDNGQIAVTSNNKTFTGDTQEALLRQGWDWAGGRGVDPGTFYTGPTQARAQAAQQVGANGW